MKPLPALAEDPRIFILLFACIWCAISYLLSIAGGWFALAKRFRGPEAVPLGTSFWFASLSVRTRLLPVAYKRCIFATVNAQGVGFSIFPVFRLGHPRLFIPWSSASGCTEGNFLFWTWTVLRIKEPRCRIAFRGRLGDEVLSRFLTSPHHSPDRVPAPGEPSVAAVQRDAHN